MFSVRQNRVTLAGPYITKILITCVLKINISIYRANKCTTILFICRDEIGNNNKLLLMFSLSDSKVSQILKSSMSNFYLFFPVNVSFGYE